MKPIEILENLSSLADLRKFQTVVKDNLVSFYRVESKFFGLYTTTVLVCVVDYSEIHNMLIINFNQQIRPHETDTILDIVNSIGGMYNCEIIKQHL